MQRKLFSWHKFWSECILIWKFVCLFDEQVIGLYKFLVLVNLAYKRRKASSSNRSPAIFLYQNVVISSPTTNFSFYEILVRIDCERCEKVHFLAPCAKFLEPNFYVHLQVANHLLITWRKFTCVVPYGSIFTGTRKLRIFFFRFIIEISWSTIFCTSCTV